MISQYQVFNLWPMTASLRNLFYRSENISCINNMCINNTLYVFNSDKNLETTWMWVGDGWLNCRIQIM